MNKKILVSLVVLLILSISLTPLAFAKTWMEKNNEKFEVFQVDLATVLEPANTMVVGPEDAPNKIMFSRVEEMTLYEITVGSKTYSLAEGHFQYDGFIVYTVWDPVLPVAIPWILTPGRQVLFDVKYMYTFLPASGIEGAIEMHAIGSGESLADVFTPGTMIITSQQGTGDLQNVNIKASGGAVHGHEGLVSGWPDTPIPS